MKLRDRDTRTRVLEMRGKARKTNETIRPGPGETGVGCRRKQERPEGTRRGDGVHADSCEGGMEAKVPEEAEGGRSAKRRRRIRKRREEEAKAAEERKRR